MATTSQSGLMKHDSESGRDTMSDVLNRGLEDLQAVGSNLRNLGRFNAGLAAASLVVMLLLGLDEAMLKLSDFTGTASTSLAAVLPVACIAGFLCSLTGIVCLIARERRRRLGNTLFMRLSDELESRYRLAHAGDLPELNEAEGSRIRALFRNYLDSATLPFMREDSPGTSYLVFHVVVVIILLELAFHLL